jgi:hypothetical protein
MAKLSYAEKLKDPRWQKKRLEIMQRDKWTCQLCGDSRQVLHVHHKEYINGREPWEYDNTQLVTVCETCHSIIETVKKAAENVDLAALRVCCIRDGGSALSCYRYGDNQPVIIVKRGSYFAPTRGEADVIRNILNTNSNGEEVH